MEQIFSWVLERSLGISVVLLVVMLLQPFLHRRYRPQLNCLVWTALALCLLIPFSLPRTKQAVVTIDWESLIARQEEQMNGAAGTEPEQLSQAEGLPVHSAQRRPAQWLPAIWLAGAATVLVGQGGIYLATRKKLLRWKAVSELMVNIIKRFFKCLERAVYSAAGGGAGGAAAALCAAA